MTRTSARPTRWRDILLFIVVAFGLAWLVTVPLWRDGGLQNPLAVILLIVMMFTPAVAALVVVLLADRSGSAPHRLGIRPFLPAKRTILLSVLGLVGAIVLVGLSVVAAAALGLVTLDLVGLSGLAEQIDAALAGAPAEGIPPLGVLLAIQLVSLPIAGIFNGIFAFGEELGWRGYLLPALIDKVGTWPALGLSGAIWGLWHSPVILLGYNYGRTDPSGVALMTLACIMLGTLIGMLTLASRNVWPAVFAHGSFNAAAGLLLLFVAAGEEPDPAVVGPLGLVAAGTMALVIVVLVAIPRVRAAVTRGTGPSD